MQLTLQIPDDPAADLRPREGRLPRILSLGLSWVDAGEGETIFARLRRIRIQGAADLSTHHDTSTIGEQDA
ncbi:hypothetical protein [uncultured Thiodictyon sp.]|jgi:hypothetical protein|uniref:hypothetical protein n=1 Tax=uncultured Thiodictyon sp. TaxID=1846217 RepID=UPI0025F54E52|nr:hypothetical protein [uncultured Thiodictyon sp.]